MNKTEILARVKKAMGITDSYLDDTLAAYIDEVIEYLTSAGVESAVALSPAAVGTITRGVLDLWNYGSAGGTLSSYFMQRAIQLSYTKEEATE